MNLRLPKSLFAAFTDDSFNRLTLMDVYKRLPGFENDTLYVSSFNEYLRLISFVYSKDNIVIHIYFNNDELEQLQFITDNYNVERSKLYSLLLASTFFTSGKYPIPVKDFFSYFMSDKQDYSYQLVITKEICDLYADMRRKQINLPMTALFRAAHFYYQNIAPGELRITESPSVTVSNMSTGWKKFYIRGNLAFKNYLFNLKKTTGKTINCIANNTAYQFLSNIQGVNL